MGFVAVATDVCGPACLYVGTFRYNGREYDGKHTALISVDLYGQVQRVFDGANKPRYTKHRHTFAGLLTCGVCGCSITAEIKKGRYVYYHCTKYTGPCGNDYIREERLADLLVDVLGRIVISRATAESIAAALRVSQRGKERLHRTDVARLNQRYVAAQQKLDAAYDDRLAGRINEVYWARRSQEWEAELVTIRADLARREAASNDYAATGSRILELAKTVKNAFLSQHPAEQRRLIDTGLSNCVYERGSLTPTYRKPFDLLVRGNQTGDWLGGRDSVSTLFFCWRAFASVT